MLIKSFLMLGQSNMAGRGFINEVPPIYNERIQMLRNGRWQMMTEPINYDRPVSGISLAGSFAEAWCLKNKEDIIGLIPCAEGGSSLDEWAIDKELFRHAVNEAKLSTRILDVTFEDDKEWITSDSIIGENQRIIDLLNVYQSLSFATINDAALVDLYVNDRANYNHLHDAINASYVLQPITATMDSIIGSI